MSGKSDTEAAIALLSEAFPDLRCLRCGHDEFLATTDVNALTDHSGKGSSVLALHNSLAAPDQKSLVVTVACRRCGHIEQHMTGPLARAKRPIELEP